MMFIMRLLFLLCLFVLIMPISTAWADEWAAEIIPQKIESKKIQIFAFSAPFIHTDFMIKRHVDSSECGTHGCATDFYKKINGGAYEKMKFSMITNGPIYKKVCGGNLSLVFAPGAGVDARYGEWQYKGDKFEMLPLHKSLDAALGCP